MTCCSFTLSIGEAQINKLHSCSFSIVKTCSSGHTLTLQIGHCRRGNEVFNFYQGGYEAIFCRIFIKRNLCQL